MNLKVKLNYIKNLFQKTNTSLVIKKSKLKLNPVVWFNDSQMSGNEINLLTDLKTKKLDSLLIFGNSFIIEQDSINKNNYNQIEGIQD